MGYFASCVLTVLFLADNSNTDNTVKNMSALPLKMREYLTNSWTLLSRKTEQHELLHNVFHLNHFTRTAAYHSLFNFGLNIHENSKNRHLNICKAGYWIIWKGSLSIDNLHDICPLSITVLLVWFYQLPLITFSHLYILALRQFEQLLSLTTYRSFHSVRNLPMQKRLFKYSQ